MGGEGITSHKIKTGSDEDLYTVYISERADFYALGEVPRVKKMERNLHATSAELTYTRLKERGVESRLKFNVRFISRYTVGFPIYCT